MIMEVLNMQHLKNIFGGIVIMGLLVIAPATVEPLTEWIISIIF
jgi:hypothetical protein